MKHTYEDIRVKRETSRVWLGVGLAVFGCVMILVGMIIPPAGVIDGSVLTAVGEVFGLSGGCIGVFALNRRDNAKIDRIYDFVEKKREDETETDTEI